jgi:hypothetical protein
MELDPEIHSHAPKVGHRWIDLALAVSVLAMSAASIIIALENESSMRRLVTANSWPYIALNHGNIQKNGEAVIHFDIRNAGIGPATVEKLVMRYDGQPVRTGRDLIKQVFGSNIDAVHRLAINMVENQVLPPREDITFLAVSKSDVAPEIWEKLDAARMKVDMAACYSSVFNEHWTTSLRNPKPVSVKTCDELPGPAYDAVLSEIQ